MKPGNVRHFEGLASELIVYPHPCGRTVFIWISLVDDLFEGGRQDGSASREVPEVTHKHSRKNSSPDPARAALAAWDDCCKTDRPACRTRVEANGIPGKSR
jgi:hypothetical protein